MSPTKTQRMLSGVKPTGTPHIGNYFGALKQFVALQDKGYEVFVMIADLHALTSVTDGQTLRKHVDNLILDYLGIGLDPEKVTLFRQSDVPEHTELAWIFNCITTMPELMRAHAFKDAEAKNKDINVGVFDYPILMAADILLYSPDVVPVGQDQKQHLEMARDTARTFNRIYGQSLKEPQELIVPSVSVVPGTDGQKMSKSYKNVIPLFGTEEEVRKAVMSIVTDSTGEVPQNVYQIHRLFRTKQELEVLYRESKGKYKDLKEALLADILAYFKPMKARRDEYEKDKEGVDSILTEGALRARKVAQEKMEEVRKAVGLR
jgi:tryptophanyl-tRNA synthetase